MKLVDLLEDYGLYEGLEGILWIKIIRNVLVREVLVLLRSLVVVFFCKLGMMVEEVVIEFGLLVVVRMMGF